MSEGVSKSTFEGILRRNESAKSVLEKKRSKERSGRPLLVLVAKSTRRVKKPYTIKSGNGIKIYLLG